LDMDSLGTWWQTGARLKATAVPRCRFALCVAVWLVVSGCTYNQYEGVQWTAERRRQAEGAESPPKLPEYPVEADLVRIDPGPGAGGRHYLIDVRSVTNSAGGAVNYTVVIEERAGTRNVLYEGLKCGAEAVKRYAFATADGRFQRRENARWLSIANDDVLGYQAFLYSSYFCDEYGYPRAERDIRNRLLGKTWTDDPALGN
jgi:hypothetical protein